MGDESSKDLRCFESFTKFFQYHWRGFCSALVPLCLLPILFYNDPTLKIPLKCVYVIALVIIYWLTDLLPIYVTAMIPMVLFPLLGVLKTKDVCVIYFNETIVMCFASFAVGLAMQYSNLHQRLAFRMMMLLGCTPRRLHISISIVTCFLSLLIPNAAATALMCPIIRSILTTMEESTSIKRVEEATVPNQDPEPTKIATAFYLAAAYAATIGGCGTLIGTAPNLIFKGIFDRTFPNAGDKVSFLKFMGCGLPLVILLTFLTVLWLQVSLMGLFIGTQEEQQIKDAQEQKDSLTEVITNQYNDLGNMNLHEIQVMALIGLMILLLITMTPQFVKGWAEFGIKDIKTSLPIMLVAILLFVFPIHYGCGRLLCGSAPFTKRMTGSLLTWKYIQSNTQWGLLFILGSGFAIALASEKSGLAHQLELFARSMEIRSLMSMQLFVICLITLLTILCANEAVAVFILPVVMGMATASNFHPLLLMYPATFACSLSFMLPTSTGSNAIVVAFANIKFTRLAIIGIVPTVLGAVIVWCDGFLIQEVIYSGSSYYPEWA